MAPSPTRYVTTRDGRAIAWTAYGDGPIDLLYVPQAISAMEHLWEHPTVAAFFSRLSRFSRVILFDRRGSAMSERLEAPAPLEEQVDDVRAVLDAAGSQRAGVFALYEGGPMAMLFAASAPERVGALVLYGCFARASRAEGYEWAWTDEERSAAMEEYRRTWGTGEVADVFAPGAGEDMRAWIGRLQRLAMDPNYAFRAATLNGSVDVRHLLPSIRVPTLVLHRTHDPVMDIRHSRYLHAHIPDARMVELGGPQGLPFLGDIEAVLGEIEEFLTGARRAPEPDRVLATVLFTDIVGSTSRAAELGDAAWSALLARHDAVVRARLERHRGREIKSVGDGFLATFDGPARAIRAARGIVDDLAEMGIEARAGLHTGECEIADGDVHGLAVHIAARVVALAGPRSVLVSGTVKDLVVGSGLGFEDAGEHDLRGVPGSWRLWEVTAG